MIEWYIQIRIRLAMIEWYRQKYGIKILSKYLDRNYKKGYLSDK